MMDDYKVNGLSLPPLLIELIRENKWLHPGDEVLKLIVSCLHESVDFLSLDEMRRESKGLIADDPEIALIFHEVRGSTLNETVKLPWLDVEKAFFIAVNRVSGDDIAIALDYRDDQTNPKVVASDWWSTPNQCIWQEVSPTFSDFIERINLAKSKLKNETN